MSLPHALLTALIERSSSGSELAARFDRSIGYFWEATHQQIYRELARLEDSGWIRGSACEGSRGRKRTYHVLSKGRTELRRWMGQHEPLQPTREALLVRLRAGAAIGPAGLTAEIERQRELHRNRLERFESIEARNFASGPHSTKTQLQHLVLQGGIARERSAVEFCTRALSILGQHELS